MDTADRRFLVQLPFQELEDHFNSCGVSGTQQHARARLADQHEAMDLNGLERIQVNALGGADTVTVNDLTGTDVNQITIDLGAQPGSIGGDGQVDTIVINGTNGAGLGSRSLSRHWSTW